MLTSFLVVTVFFFAVAFILGTFAGKRWDDKQSQEGVGAVITYGAAALSLIASYSGFAGVMYLPTMGFIVAVLMGAAAGATWLLLVGGIAAVALLILNIWLPFALTRHVINCQRHKDVPAAETPSPSDMA